MQELKRTVLFERGSTLVTVVTFAGILAIAICGFLGVARTMTNQENVEMNDDRAFVAAESGLLIGTRWLRDSANWELYHLTGYPGNVYEGFINGFSVAATVTPEQNGDLLIRSTASGPALPYEKKLSWTVRVDLTTPSVFINDLSKAGGVGGGGLNNEWFDGPVRLNTPIYISSVSGGNVNVRFVNGYVKVHNMTEQISFDDSGHWGNYGTSPVSGNDYDFGIWHHSAQPGQYEKIDPLFEHNGAYEEFQHSQDSLYMPETETPTYTLPKNMSASDTAILHFHVYNASGVADYYYYDASGNQHTESFSTASQIVRVQNSVSVLGTVKGQVTVVTDSGCDILPAGDLMYSGYTPDNEDMDAYDNSGNYGLGSYGPLNDNVCALVAGRDIFFGLDKHTLSTVGDSAFLEEVEGHGRHNPVMYLTAQLVSTGPGHGIRWASTNVNRYNYTLRALGTRAIDVYEESHNAQGTPGGGAFRFFYDTRFTEGLNAPGVPQLRSRNLFIINTTWREENVL
jgi:hypothetical protein